MSDQNPLELTSTDDLLEELRRRSKAIFLAMIPLAEHKEFRQIYSLGVDGGRAVTADDADRCLGLAYRAMLQCVSEGGGFR